MHTITNIYNKIKDKVIHFIDSNDDNLYNISMPRPKKIKEPVDQANDPKYNKYGVCIACQNGDPECHHNSLVYQGRDLVCSKCGFKVK